MWVDVITALLVRLASDYDDLLQLEFVQVTGSQRHNEALYGAMNATNHDMVLNVGILERSQRLTNDGPCILRAVHVIVIHHFLVLPLLLVDLVAVCESQRVHTNVLLLINRATLVIVALSVLVLVPVIALLKTLGQVAIGLLLGHLERFNLLSLIGAGANNVDVDLIVDDVVDDEVARVEPNDGVPVRLDLYGKDDAVVLLSVY